MRAIPTVPGALRSTICYQPMSLYHVIQKITASSSTALINEENHNTRGHKVKA